MTALLFLVAALAALWASSRRPEMARAAAVPALLLCAFAGLTLPDIDQPLPLDHRSALTHSILPALIALWRRWARPAAAGLALGLGLHLAADVFPNAMVGFAMVKMPLAGSVGAELSYAWLAANAAACSLLGGKLLQAEIRGAALRVVALAATAILGVWYLLRVDGGWPALAVYALAAWLVLRPRSRRGRVGARA